MASHHVQVVLGKSGSSHIARASFHINDVLLHQLIAGQPSINGKLYGSRPFNMAIDSGTTVIVAPSGEAKAFWRSVPGAAPYSAAAGYWTFPCKSPPSVGPHQLSPHELA